VALYIAKVLADPARPGPTADQTRHNAPVSCSILVAVSSLDRYRAAATFTATDAREGRRGMHTANNMRASASAEETDWHETGKAGYKRVSSSAGHRSVN
jgi:hypothetical protein